MNPTGTEDRFLGGYWRFVGRFFRIYVYTVILAGAALLAFDHFFPNRIFPFLRYVLDNL